MLVTTALPAVIVGLVRLTEIARPLAAAVAVVLAVLSTAPHKEYRFLFPLAPILCVFAGRGFEVFKV